MTQLVRLGAVGYLNARPLVAGLDRSDRFSLRFDVPSRCATLLHDGQIDVGLIPSIEYLRAASRDGYRIVPRVAIASRGAVASVAIYTTKPIREIRSLALDTSSRTSVALARVLCARAFGVHPTFYHQAPDVPAMLADADAALIIGDNALFLEHGTIGRAVDSSIDSRIEKIDLGKAWTDMTGLPFVYAFWAGSPDALSSADVDALLQAKHDGLARVDAIAAEYFPGSPERQAAGARYLRDNIKYDLDGDERTALESFYAYAVEDGVVEAALPLRFYGE